MQVSLFVSIIYLVLGLLRLGFVTHFLSQPIISAFLTAGTIIISLSQVGSLFAVSATGHYMPGSACNSELGPHLGPVAKTHKSKLVLGSTCPWPVNGMMTTSLLDYSLQHIPCIVLAQHTRDILAVVAGLYLLCLFFAFLLVLAKRRNDASCSLQCTPDKTTK